MPMPLCMAVPGTPARVSSVRGKDEARRFLENLGFVPGTPVTVITELDGNLIVAVRGARVAISRGMASKILVS